MRSGKYSKTIGFKQALDPNIVAHLNNSFRQCTPRVRKKFTARGKELHLASLAIVAKTTGFLIGPAKIFVNFHFAAALAAIPLNQTQQLFLQQKFARTPNFFRNIVGAQWAQN